MEHHMAATAAEAESNSIMNARRAADEINAVAKTPAPSRRVNGAQLSAQFQVDTDAATASGGGGGGGGGGVYRELLRMALVDGKLAAGESVQLEKARRQYGITWEQHHQLLNELTNGTGNVHVEAPRGRVHNQIRKASSNVTMTPISTGGRVGGMPSAVPLVGSAAPSTAPVGLRSPQNFLRGNAFVGNHASSEQQAQWNVQAQQQRTQMQQQRVQQQLQQQEQQHRTQMQMRQQPLVSPADVRAAQSVAENARRAQAEISMRSAVGSSFTGGGGGGGGGGVYRELLRMALVDGKLAAGESAQLGEARRQYGITWEQHHQLLNELTNGTGNVRMQPPQPPQQHVEGASYLAHSV
jgi:hypothetical protein